MERWRTIFAFAVAGALVASPVLAQTGSTSSPPKGSEQSKPADAAKPDAAKPSDSPAAAPKTSGTDASKDAAKSGEMKKDAAKDTMKSDPMMKSGDKAAGNREQVQAAQQALKEKGHDPGSIDGVMGPKTQAALKDFQKAHGLKETGRLDAETSAKLGVDTAAAASPRGSQPSASPSGSPPSGSTPAPSKDPSASPGATSPSKSSKDPTTPAKPPQKP